MGLGSIVVGAATAVNQARVLKERRHRKELQVLSR